MVAPLSCTHTHHVTRTQKGARLILSSLNNSATKSHNCILNPSQFTSRFTLALAKTFYMSILILKGGRWYFKLLGSPGRAGVPEWLPQNADCRICDTGELKNEMLMIAAIVCLSPRLALWRMDMMCRRSTSSSLDVLGAELKFSGYESSKSSSGWTSFFTIAVFGSEWRLWLGYIGRSAVRSLQIVGAMVGLVQLRWDERDLRVMTIDRKLKIFSSLLVLSDYWNLTSYVFRLISRTWEFEEGNSNS